MLKAYEEQIGKIKLQQLPSDTSIQMEDKSEVLDDQEWISLFRSIVGSGIYLCQERYDVAFTVKELGFKNGSNNYGISSLEEVLGIFEDYGLLSSKLNSRKQEKAM